VLFFFQKNKRNVLWVIHYYLLFSVSRQIIIQILSNSYPEIVDIIGKLNPLTNYLFIASFFYAANDKKLDKRFIFFISLLYIPTQFLQFIFTLTSVSSSIISTINTIIILGLCLIYFYNQLKKPDIIFIYLDSSFWITSAFFLFSAGTFFVFWFNLLYKNDENFTYQYVYIHAIIFLIRNIVFSIAFLIKPYKEKPLEFSLKTNNEY
ncbi:MAG: hypothetical protein ACK55K_06600, partial [Bacteroidota bacterium]